jgi:hypothetical protein
VPSIVATITISPTLLAVLIAAATEPTTLRRRGPQGSVIFTSTRGSAAVVAFTGRGDGSSIVPIVALGLVPTLSSTATSTASLVLWGSRAALSSRLRLCRSSLSGVLLGFGDLEVC